MWWKAGCRALYRSPLLCQRFRNDFPRFPPEQKKKYFLNQIDLDHERQSMLQDYLMKPEYFRDREGGLREDLEQSLTREQYIDERMSTKALDAQDYFKVKSFTSMEEMMAAGVHFGHQKGTWDPQMRDYLLGHRFGTHIINLDETERHLVRALEFLCHCVYRGCRVMFVNCRPHFQYLTQATARECGEFFFTGRWQTGLFTDCKNKLGTIRLPDLMIGTSPNVCAEAYLEANHLGIPIISLVDSDSDPRIVTYPIPANDDTESSVQLFCRVFRDAILRAKEIKIKDHAMMNRTTPLDITEVNSKVQDLVDGLEDDFAEIERKSSMILAQVEQRFPQ